jgi:hypothetical protein
MVDDCDALDTGRKLLEQLQPFHADCKFVLRESGDVAAGSRQTCDETGTDWISYLREQDTKSLSENIRRDYRVFGA